MSLQEVVEWRSVVHLVMSRQMTSKALLAAALPQRMRLIRLGQTAEL